MTRINADGTRQDDIEPDRRPSSTRSPSSSSGADAGTTQAAGAIIRGMTRQVGNEIDEFVTDALRNNSLGLPLDLAAINIARGRDTGVPRSTRPASSSTRDRADTQLKPYDELGRLRVNLKNPASIINFIAAYGTHAIDRRRDDARRQARRRRSAARLGRHRRCPADGSTS